MINWLERLKNRWKIKNNFSLLVIIVVFTLTGSSSVYVSNALIDTLGNWITLEGWFKVICKILITTPIYIVLLLTIGSLLGQYHFFSNFALKMIKGIGKLFGLGKKK